MLLSPALADDAETETGTVTVRVQGLGSNDGQLRYTVFDSKKNFLKRPFRSGVSEIDNREGVWSADDLPFGVYAILVHHDENANNKMESHWYGKPKEPTGASNNPPPRMGPPKFDDASFTLDAKTKSLLITLP
jgi:uncharacterized protein (DUF2141 family)